MALCSGESHAIRVMRRTVSSQQQVILQQNSLLCRGNIQCPLDPDLAVAAAIGVDVPGLYPRNMDINSRLCRLLATRFPDVISFDESTTFQNMVLRVEPSSAPPSHQRWL